MNILFLSLHDFNTIESPGIYTDVLREFYINGHNLYIVSPKQNGGKEVCKLIIENERVSILKTSIGNIQTSNLFEKGISTITLSKKILKDIVENFQGVKFDLLLYTTPPITFNNIIKLFKKRDNCITYLLLKDIFPQNAVDLKMFSKISPLYFYFRKMEKELYEVSDFIGTMSPGNSKYILEHNTIAKDKVEENPNSTSIETITDNLPIDSQKNEIRAKYKIPTDKYVFLYGGNLGKPQGIDFLIDCILLNENNNNSFILIVGTGTEYKKLDHFFKINNPQNARLIKFLPPEEYNEIARVSDVGLVLLHHSFTIPNFPSRILSYMRNSMPILAATDVVTDVRELIENNELGFWTESANPADFNYYLQKLCDKRLINRYGANSRSYLENNFSSKSTYEKIISHVK